VDALDSETSQPVPFSYSLTLSSTPVHLEGRAEEGRFRLRVSDEDHAYLVKLTSPGYENLTLTGGLKAGETKILQALMRYDPFDLELSENSGEVSRPYSSQIYSGTTSEPFTASRQVFDHYEEEQENKLKGYKWEEKVTKESATKEGMVVGYKYSYTEYRRNWHWLPPGWGDWYYYGSGTETFSEDRGSSFTDGGSWYQGWKKEYTLQAYICEVWEPRSGSSPPMPSDKIRNLQEVYEVVKKKVPVYRTETYTAYHIYSIGHVTYSPQPWPARQVKLTIRPKNGYEGRVALETSSPGVGLRITSGNISGYQWEENENGIRRIRTGSSLPEGVRITRLLFSFHSPAEATLYLTPESEGTFTVKLRAYDENGRFVENLVYTLRASDPKPIPTSWRNWIRDDTKPDEQKPTLVSTTEERRSLPNITTSAPIWDGGSCMDEKLGIFGAHKPNVNPSALFIMDPSTHQYIYGNSGKEKGYPEKWKGSLPKSY
jgi:hypothetical protein